jgi:methionyl-tRNA formyltransferase
VRVLFAGSPEIAVPALTAFGAHGLLVGVLTNPPAAKGRGLGVAATPVADAAANFQVPVLAPEKLGPAEREAVSAMRPDILVSFAYGTIFGPKFMALFPRGGINAHPSLLPRWRGASPIPYAIMHRDRVTGVCVQWIAPRMDAGDILARREIVLDGTETSGSLSMVAAEIGAELLVRIVEDLEEAQLRGEPQDESAATYTSLLTKDDGLVDWNAPAVGIDAKVRACTPWPGAFTGFKGQRLALLDVKPYPDLPGPGTRLPPGTILSVDKSRGIMVQTSEGLLALERLQLRGKKAMGFKDFSNGARDLAGSFLGTPL